MKKETMLKAFTDIDDDLIEEAAPAGYLPKKKSVFGWLNSKMLAGAMAVLMIAVVSALILPNTDQNHNVNLTRPDTVYSTLEEAEKIAGFELDCPETYHEWTVSRISVYSETMIEVIYQNSAEEEMMRVRKAEGSDDISGDYNHYAQEETLQAGAKTVTAKGSEDQFSLLTWNDQGYSYAVLFQEPVGSEEAAGIAEMIH